MYPTIVVFAATGLVALWRITADHWRDVAGGRSFGEVMRTFGTPEP
jgi:hypothetical protein